MLQKSNGASVCLAAHVGALRNSLTAVHVRLLCGLHGADSVIELHVHDLVAHALEQLTLLLLGLGQTRCDATSGLLSLIPINDLGNIGVEVHLELILRQACLRNSLPKAGDVIRLHLLVLRWRLIQLRQLDEEAVLE